MISPMLVPRNDLQTQHPSIPFGRLPPIGHKQFDVINLVYTEFSVRWRVIHRIALFRVVEVAQRPGLSGTPQAV